MSRLHRLTGVVVLALAAAITPLGIAGATPASADGPAPARTSIAIEFHPDAAKGCWEAECGAGEVPIKFVWPSCYAHEGSQYLPWCQDIYP
jgi:hypothetical protein